MYDTNFFGSMSWQQLNVISFVSRDMTRQKNCMCLGVVVEEADKNVDLNKKQDIVSYVSICSACVSLW